MLSMETKSDFIKTLERFIFNPQWDFEKYEKNKYTFFKDFGNKLIVSKNNVSIIMNDESRQKAYTDFLSYIPREDQYQCFKDLIITNGLNGFIENKIIKTLYVLLHNNSPAFVVSNIIDNHNIKSLKIPQGMKLSRAFKYVIDNAYGLNTMQVKYSQYINNIQVSGNIHLSIHPLDYLSISQNNNGWRSCHSLDGEYAAGTLSLMCDRTTIIAYLANSELENINLRGTLKSEPPLWNSKKWRVLIHIDKSRNKFIFSKQYPYHSFELEKEVVVLLKQIYPHLQPFEVRNWDSHKDEIGNVRNAVHYNDISRGSHTLGRVLETDSSHTKILVGSTIPCLHCGDSNIEDSMAFACMSCSPTPYEDCDICGASGFTNEDLFWVDSESVNVCIDCYNQSYATCITCWTVIRQNDLAEDEASCQFCYDRELVTNESSG